MVREKGERGGSGALSVREDGIDVPVATKLGAPHEVAEQSPLPGLFCSTALQSCCDAAARCGRTAVRCCALLYAAVRCCVLLCAAVCCCVLLCVS